MNSMGKRSFHLASLPHISSSLYHPIQALRFPHPNIFSHSIKTPIFLTFLLLRPFSTNLESLVNSLLNSGSSSLEAKRRIEQCGLSPSPSLVAEVLSRLRNNWSAAFTFFLWAGKQPQYAHSLREYHSMISILGKFRRFDTAWSLVNEMNAVDPSLVSPQTLLILIRKYSSKHDVGSAIAVFYSFKRFKLEAGIEEFQGLLGALCRYKNVEDAQNLLLCNQGTFPFETKSFNIVLNGWCNILARVGEAKRFWKEYESRRVDRDVVSYSCMISCFSKASNLNDVTRLFDRMRRAGVSPDRKVYNAVVYALAKARRIDQAKGHIKLMEGEGIAPNAVTFNSLIRPLCRFHRLQEAREVFDEMLQRSITPSIRTFHALFDALATEEEVFELLHQMRQMNCRPTLDTHIMLIRKLCRWRLHDSVFKLWNQIIESGLSPDRSAYITLIHGLFLNGKLEEASKYYEEMKEKGFSPEPKTDEMIEAWLTGKVAAENPDFSHF